MQLPESYQRERSGAGLGLTAEARVGRLRERDYLAGIAVFTSVPKVPATNPGDTGAKDLEASQS